MKMSPIKQGRYKLQRNYAYGDARKTQFSIWHRRHNERDNLSAALFSDKAWGFKGVRKRTPLLYKTFLQLSCASFAVYTAVCAGMRDLEHMLNLLLTRCDASRVEATVNVLYIARIVKRGISVLPCFFKKL